MRGRALSRGWRALGVAAGIALVATALGGAPQDAISDRIAELEGRAQILGEHMAEVKSVLEYLQVDLDVCSVHRLALIVESQHSSLSRDRAWEDLVWSLSTDCDAATTRALRPSR